MPETAEISKKPRGKSFAAGKSGNPGGRPKLPEDVKHVRELAREWTVQSIAALAGVLKSKSDAARVSAATTLLERGWGKPEQPITGADGAALPVPTINVSSLTNEQIRILASIPVQSG